jgi:RNA polymerase sigma-70 factor, ECF subfamily
MMPSVSATRAAEELSLDPTAELEAFLAGVERAALRIARHYTGDHDEALDLVQDAMIRLARRYAGEPPETWRALFFGILRNRLHDWHRRTRVRRRLLAWWPGGEPEEAPLESLPGPDALQPEREVASAAAMAALDSALRQLPDRQREAFLLRTVDGMDVADTARAMGVSAGSVKTHYHRAVQRLRALLGDHWHD